MTEEETKKLVIERLRAFGEAVRAANLGNIPHIVVVFDDKGEVANIGYTPHFSNELTRIKALLDLVRAGISSMEAEKAKEIDNFLLSNLMQANLGKPIN